jgi:hypothetical protein
MTFRKPFPVKRDRAVHSTQETPPVTIISPNSKMVISVLNSLQSTDDPMPAAPVAPFNQTTQIKISTLSEAESKYLSSRKRSKLIGSVKLNTQDLFPNNQPSTQTASPVDSVGDLPLHLEAYRPQLETLFAPKKTGANKQSSHSFIPNDQRYFK